MKVQSNMVRKNTSTSSRRNKPAVNSNPCEASVFAEALGRLGGDEELLRELAAILLDDIPPLLEGIQSSIEAGDFEEAHHDAHAIKGLVVTFDERGCGLLVSELMSALKDNDEHEVHRLCHTCVEAVQTLQSHCERLLSK